MESKKRRSGGRLQKRLSRTLYAGTGTVVLATAMIAAPRAEASIASEKPLEPRAREARSQLAPDAGAPRSSNAPGQVAWWGNWHNWGYHPYWHNWPNWHNWHNWHNWRNW